MVVVMVAMVMVAMVVAMVVRVVVALFLMFLGNGRLLSCGRAAAGTGRTCGGHEAQARRREDSNDGHGENSTPGCNETVRKMIHVLLLCEGVAEKSTVTGMRLITIGTSHSWQHIKRVYHSQVGRR
jgi:hypothetical protein